MQLREDRPLVEISNLSVWFPEHYGDIPVIDDVSISISSGETLGVVGESGSGKTLLGLAILGLLPLNAQTTGSVFVNGVDMLSGSNHEIKSIRGSIVTGVFQDALISLNPNRTIGGHFRDVWKSAAATSGNWRDAAREALEMAALGRQSERVLDSYPHELSGGMRQRALIALALLRRPILIIADEPTTALDVIVEREVLATLQRLREELHLGMVLISHDFDVIRDMCSRTAVLYAGQLCEIGPTAALVTRPLHRYTSALISSIESLTNQVRPLSTIPGVVPQPSDFSPGCRFLGRCPAGDAACEETRPRINHSERYAWCHHIDESHVTCPASSS